MEIRATTPPAGLAGQVSLWLAGYVALGGLVSLFGWVLDVPPVTDWFATGTSIQPNAAMAALVFGAALLLGNWDQRVAAVIGGSLLAALGGSTLFQHVTGISLGIDTLLMFERTWGGGNTLAPGRMGLPASVAYTLGGLGIALAQIRSTARYASGIGLSLVAIAGLSLTGYLFGAGLLYAVPRFTAISLQTASFLFLGGLALVASVPAVEPMRTLLSDSSAGIMVRRTLPFVVTLPVALGVVLVWEQRLGFYDAAVGTAILVLVLVALLCTVLWRGARAVQLRERELSAVRQARRLAEAARLDAESRIVRLLESIDDAFASFDAEWRYTYLNSAGERAIAKGRDEVLGRVIWDVFPDFFSTEEGANLRRAATTRSVIEFEEFNPVVGRWYSNRAYPTPDGGLAIYFRDLTETRRAEQSMAKAQSELLVTTDNAPVMLAHCDAAGRFLFVNRPYAERFALTREEIVGRTLADVVGNAAYRRLAGHIEAVMTGQEVKFEMPIPRGPRGPEVLHVALTPERDGNGRVIGFVAALIDITERKRAEDALRDADRRKDEFLATLSHELRNPLAPITNCIAILRRAAGDPLLSERTVATLDRQVRYMVRLVDDLLDVSRITRNALILRKDNVELGAVISLAVEAFEPQAERAQQSLVVEVEPGPVMQVDGDRVRLVQIIGNLVSNACRYSDPGTPITVSAWRDGKWAVVTVADKGLGIAADKLERIFEPFTQLQPALERSQGGLGIGLHLARRLAVLHGGSLQAYSRGEGEGSQFELRLPLQSASE